MTGGKGLVVSFWMLILILGGEEAASGGWRLVGGSWDKVDRGNAEDAENISR